MNLKKGGAELSSLTKTEKKLPTLSLNYCESTEVFDSLIENELLNDDELYFFPDPIPSKANNVAILGADGRILDSGKQFSPTDLGAAPLSSLDTKTDKQIPSAAGNIATLDSNGNLVDSGKQPTPSDIGADPKGAGLYSGFTEIPTNSDLNNYLTCGYYRQPVSGNGSTIANCPTQGAFTLIVSNALGYNESEDIVGKTWRYRQQRFTLLGGDEYTRTIYTDGNGAVNYGDWKKMLNSESGLSDLGISSGSWTPTVSGMSSYSYRKGRYVAIGDVAIVSFTFWGTMAGSNTEQIKISGCPFTTANGGYSGGGHLSGYYVSDDIVFSGWSTSTDGGIYAYGQITGTGNKWGQSAIYQKNSGECGGGGTIMFKISS